jgi:hypothetical protein
MYECNVCNKEFDSHRKLNGHKSIHKENGRYSVSRRTKQEIECLNCKTLTYNPKYCSMNCQQTHKWNNKYNKISEGDILSEGYMRRYITETKGYKCEDCGCGSTWNNKPITLQLDHIDGNSDNNSLDNIRWLCPNCHTQTDTWCARNKKNSVRSNRRNKYKPG